MGQIEKATAAGQVLPKARDMGAELAWMVQEFVRQVVTDPEAATVTGSARHGLVEILVTVAPKDMGRVIGKNGVTAHSLRMLLDAAGRKNDVRCLLNIQEVE